MLLTAVSQVVFYVLYALVINTKSTSISGPENARQRLVMSTNIAQCNHLTQHLGTTEGARILNGSRSSLLEAPMPQE